MRGTPVGWRCWSGEEVVISRPTHAWERQTAPVNEGAFPLYRDGQTFVIYAADWMAYHANNQVTDGCDTGGRRQLSRQR